MDVDQAARCRQVAGDVDRRTRRIELDAATRGGDGAVLRTAASGRIIGVGDGAGSG